MAVDPGVALKAGSGTDERRLVAAVNRVIDRRDITTLFQPLVDLATTDLVGFEALTRGPAGSEVESPLAASLLSSALRRSHPRQEPSAVVPHAGICAGAARKGGPYRDPFRRQTLHRAGHCASTPCRRGRQHPRGWGRC